MEPDWSLPLERSLALADFPCSCSEILSLLWRELLKPSRLLLELFTFLEDPPEAYGVVAMLPEKLSPDGEGREGSCCCLDP